MKDSNDKYSDPNMDFMNEEIFVEENKFDSYKSAKEEFLLNPNFREAVKTILNLDLDNSNKLVSNFEFQDYITAKKEISNNKSFRRAIVSNFEIKLNEIGEDFNEFKSLAAIDKNEKIQNMFSSLANSVYDGTKLISIIDNDNDLQDYFLKASNIVKKKVDYENKENYDTEFYESKIEDAIDLAKSSLKKEPPVLTDVAEEFSNNFDDFITVEKTSQQKIAEYLRETNGISSVEDSIRKAGVDALKEARELNKQGKSLSEISSRAINASDNRSEDVNQFLVSKKEIINNKPNSKRNNR